MKKLILRGFGVTTFVFLTMWGVSGLTSIQLFTAFDPISQALKEFELTDIVFSKLRPEPVPDSRIVIVNIGPSRRHIAQQIRAHAHDAGCSRAGALVSIRSHALNALVAYLEHHKAK